MSSRYGPVKCTETRQEWKHTRRLPYYILLDNLFRSNWNVDCFTIKKSILYGNGGLHGCMCLVLRSLLVSLLQFCHFVSVHEKGSQPPNRLWCSSPLKASTKRAFLWWVESFTGSGGMYIRLETGCTWCKVSACSLTTASTGLLCILHSTQRILFC